MHVTVIVAVWLIIGETLYSADCCPNTIIVCIVYLYKLQIKNHI